MELTLLILVAISTQSYGQNLAAQSINVDNDNAAFPPPMTTPPSVSDQTPDYGNDGDDNTSSDYDPSSEMTDYPGEHQNRFFVNPESMNTFTLDDAIVGKLKPGRDNGPEIVMTHNVIYPYSKNDDPQTPLSPNHKEYSPVTSFVPNGLLQVPEGWEFIPYKNITDDHVFLRDTRKVDPELVKFIQNMFSQDNSSSRSFHDSFKLPFSDVYLKYFQRKESSGGFPTQNSVKSKVPQIFSSDFNDPLIQPLGRKDEALLPTREDLETIVNGLKKIAIVKVDMDPNTPDLLAPNYSHQEDASAVRVPRPLPTPSDGPDSEQSYEYYGYNQDVVSLHPRTIDTQLPENSNGVLGKRRKRSNEDDTMLQTPVQVHIIDDSRGPEHPDHLSTFSINKPGVYKVFEKVYTIPPVLGDGSKRDIKSHGVSEDPSFEAKTFESNNDHVEELLSSRNAGVQLTHIDHSFSNTPIKKEDQRSKIDLAEESLKDGSDRTNYFEKVGNFLVDKPPSAAFQTSVGSDRQISSSHAEVSIGALSTESVTIGSLVNTNGVTKSAFTDPHANTLPTKIVNASSQNSKEFGTSNNKDTFLQGKQETAHSVGRHSYGNNQLGTNKANEPNIEESLSSTRSNSGLNLKDFGTTKPVMTIKNIPRGEVTHDEPAYKEQNFGHSEFPTTDKLTAKLDKFFTSKIFKHENKNSRGKYPMKSYKRKWANSWSNFNEEFPSRADDFPESNSRNIRNNNFDHIKADNLKNDDPTPEDFNFPDISNIFDNFARDVNWDIYDTKKDSTESHSRLRRSASSSVLRKTQTVNLVIPVYFELPQVEGLDESFTPVLQIGSPSFDNSGGPRQVNIELVEQKTEGSQTSSEGPTKPKNKGDEQNRLERRTPAGEDNEVSPLPTLLLENGSKKQEVTQVIPQFKTKVVGGNNLDPAANSVIEIEFDVPPGRGEITGEQLKAEIVGIDEETNDLILLTGVHETPIRLSLKDLGIELNPDDELEILAPNAPNLQIPLSRQRDSDVIENERKVVSQVPLVNDRQPIVLPTKSSTRLETSSATERFPTLLPEPFPSTPKFSTRLQDSIQPTEKIPTFLENPPSSVTKFSTRLQESLPTTTRFSALLQVPSSTTTKFLTPEPSPTPTPKFSRVIEETSNSDSNAKKPSTSNTIKTLMKIHRSKQDVTEGRNTDASDTKRETMSHGELDTSSEAFTDLDFDLKAERFVGDKDYFSPDYQEENPLLLDSWSSNSDLDSIKENDDSIYHTGQGTHTLPSRDKGLLALKLRYLRRLRALLEAQKFLDMVSPEEKSKAQERRERRYLYQQLRGRGYHQYAVNDNGDITLRLLPF